MPRFRAELAKSCPGGRGPEVWVKRDDLLGLLQGGTRPVVPGDSDMAAAMQRVADSLTAEGRKAYFIPGGGSDALGGLGYVACAQNCSGNASRKASTSTASSSARTAPARTEACSRAALSARRHIDRRDRRQPRTG